MCPAYGNQCFTRPAIHVWCTNFARGRECIVDEERPGWHVAVITDTRIAAVDTFIDRWDKCLTNLDSMLKNKTLMFNIERG